MTGAEKDLMERYIYEVIRRIPKGQRDEIGMELRELISDMYESRKGTMETVLMELGSPIEFAKKYRDESRYLIGPEYYDNYLWVMKIVLICIIPAIVLATFIQGATEQMEFADILAEFLSNLLGSIFGCIGTITLIFAVLERQRVSMDMQKDTWNVDQLKEDTSKDWRNWTPDQLPPIPDKRAVISRGDSIVSIIFMVVFTGILILAPQLFGFYVIEDKEILKVISVFNLEKWNVVLPFILISFLVGFIDEIIRLVNGRYCFIVMFSNIIAGILQLVLSAIILRVLPFWNLQFVSEIKQHYGADFRLDGDLLNYLNIDFLSGAVLFVIAASIFIEIGVTIYRTLRYGEKLI